MRYTHTMKSSALETAILSAAFIGTLILVGMMMLPFINTVFLAAIFAFLFSGLYNRLLRHIPNRTLASLIITTLVLLVILIPLALVGYQIAQEATNLYAFLRERSAGADISHILQQFQGVTGSLIPASAIDASAVSDRLQQVLGWIIGNLGTAFTGITRIILNFFFLLLFFYYLTKDGESMLARLIKASPITDSHEREILARIQGSISATVRGQVLVAVLQGLVGGLGLAFFNVPNPALWGTILMLASFIPVFGTGLVQIPAIIYLVATLQYASAVGLGLWAMLAVGLLDNVLGPKLMSNGLRVHPLLTMLSVLGGISMFGPIGIVLGPVLTSVLLAIGEILLTHAHRS